MKLDDQALYLPPEAQQVLRAGSTRTLERWRMNGTGPAFVKIGRKVAYTGQALREYLQRQTRTFTAESK